MLRYDKFDNTNRWSEMGPSRDRIIRTSLVLGVFLVLTRYMSDDKTWISESAIVGIFIVLDKFPALRNEKAIWTLCLVGVCAQHILGCFTLVQSLSFGQTTTISQNNETFFPALVRVLVLPSALMLWCAQIGFSMSVVVSLGLMASLLGFVTVIMVSMAISPELGFQNLMHLGIWSFVPTSFITHLLFDHECRVEQVRLIVQNASKSETKHQQAAATNQQRIMGYIFHEVRNSINNIMLASEILLDLLSTPEAPTTLASSSKSSKIPSRKISSNPLSQSRLRTRSTVAPLFVADGLTRSMSTVSGNQHKSPPCWRFGPQGVKEIVEDIHQSTKAAVRVLNDALNLQKLQSGAFEFAYKPFRLEDLVSGTARMMQSQLKKKGIRMGQVIDRRLRGVAVDGDFHRLQQVLINYLNNAFKFTPPNGSIEVRMTLDKDTVIQNNTDLDSICVTTSVFNTGDGISEQDRPKIFQPWSQIRAGEQQEGQGSGLGLALCKGFIERGHQGKVGFTSTVGKGTEFFFTIQFHTCDPQLISPATPEAAGTLTHKSSSSVARHSAVAMMDFNNQDDSDSDNDNSSNHSNVGLSKHSSLDNNIDHNEQQPTQSYSSAADVQIGANNNEEALNRDVHHIHSAQIEQTIEGDSEVPNDSEAPSVWGESPMCENWDEGQADNVDVMVVEDSYLSRKLLARVLDTMGVTYHLCVDGQEAVEKITKHGVTFCSLVLMDKEMPRMDGFEATSRLRSLGYTRPIVGCTGNAMDNQVAEFLQIGADQVLGKPISCATLRCTLEHYGIGQSSATPSPPQSTSQTPSQSSPPSQSQSYPSS